MGLLLTVLRRMPKPVRRAVGRAWSKYDRYKAYEALDGYEPFCDRCDALMTWNPYTKVWECPYEKEKTRG